MNGVVKFPLQAAVAAELDRLQEEGQSWDMELGKPHMDINFHSTPYDDATPSDVEPSNVPLRSKEYRLDPPTHQIDFQIDLQSTAGRICREAAELVDGDRGKSHGPADEQHETMAALISAILGACTLPLRPHQAALIEVCLKLSRCFHGEYNEDDYRDGAAYFGIAGMLAKQGK